VLTVLLSLFFSVELTAAVGAQAFFSTGARIWELGIGAILALVLQSPPALLARFGFPAAFLGLVLIGFSAVHWAPKADWPGWRALVPTVGTALVIAGGTMSPTNAASRVYARSLAPMLTAKLAVAAADEPRWR
jgi:peptidoglycan/LPS O-acetylase OafA/YrhL